MYTVLLVITVIVAFLGFSAAYVHKSEHIAQCDRKYRTP
jgi:hypothetical protein